MSDPRFDRDELNRPVDGDFDRSRSSNAMWGWIAGIVFLVIVMALVFGPASTGDNQSAMNDRPAANSMTTGAGAPNSVTPNTQISRPAPAPSGIGTNPATPSTTGQGSNQ
jgi:hypothetical protein